MILLGGSVNRTRAISYYIYEISNYDQGGDGMQDAELLRLYQAKDEHAIAETDAKYGAKLRQIANELLGSKQDAEEIVSDVLMQAWQKIRDAVDFSTNRDEARKQYDQLSPLLKKLAGSPSQLISWRKVNEDTFEGVIASNVQRSYRELARREAVFYAIPGQLQAEQTWRVEGPKEQAALPEAEKPKKLAYEKPEWMIRREENGEKF